MAQINEEIEINAPIATVYNEWADLTQLPNILGIVEEVELFSSNMSHWKLSIAGKKKEYEASITSMQPENHIAWQAVSGEDTGGSVTFEEVAPNVTKIRLIVNWVPEGIVENIGEALNLDDGAVRTDLLRFKENMETQ